MAYFISIYITSLVFLLSLPSRSNSNAKNNILLFYSMDSVVTATQISSWPQWPQQKLEDQSRVWIKRKQSWVLWNSSWDLTDTVFIFLLLILNQIILLDDSPLLVYFTLTLQEDSLYFILCFFLHQEIWP